jgi:hypothetical protein
MHGSSRKVPSKISRPYIYVKFLVLLGAPYIYIYIYIYIYMTVVGLGLMLNWNGYESRNCVASFEAMSRYLSGKASK